MLAATDSEADLGADAHINLQADTNLEAADWDAYNDFVGDLGDAYQNSGIKSWALNKMQNAYVGLGGSAE